MSHSLTLHEHLSWDVCCGYRIFRSSRSNSAVSGGSIASCDERSQARKLRMFKLGSSTKVTLELSPSNPYWKN